MSHLPLEKLPGQSALVGRLYTNNSAPNTKFAIKDNLGTGSAPSTANDSTQGYAVGSIWIDTTNFEAYLCFDASVGAAVWKQITAASGSQLPVGVVLPYSGAVAPTGFIDADGVDQDRVALANLHALYQADGYIYGIGDGATTFGIPDYRGRVPAGKDDMGGNDAGRLTSGAGRPDGDVLGDAGGLETNTLLITHMPAHTHTGSTNTTGGHTHNVTAVEDSTADAAADGTGDNEAGNQMTFATSSSGSHSHTLAIDSNGGSSPHDNVQPTIVQNYIIKT